jgi:hypothetical protein
MTGAATLLRGEVPGAASSTCVDRRTSRRDDIQGDRGARGAAADVGESVCGVVVMVKPGNLPVTIPLSKGETMPIGLTQAILKQAGLDDG